MKVIIVFSGLPRIITIIPVINKITIKKSDDKTFDLVRIKGMEEDRESKEKRRVEFFEELLF